MSLLSVLDDLNGDDYIRTRNCLIYTLYIDLDSASYDKSNGNSQDVIDLIIEKTIELCKNYTFHYRLLGYKKDSYDDDIWNCLLINHCLVSSLNTIKEMIIDERESLYLKKHKNKKDNNKYFKEIFPSINAIQNKYQEYGYYTLSRKYGDDLYKTKSSRYDMKRLSVHSANYLFSRGTAFMTNKSSRWSHNLLKTGDDSTQLFVSFRNSNLFYLLCEYSASIDRKISTILKNYEKYTFNQLNNINTEFGKYFNTINTRLTYDTNLKGEDDYSSLAFGCKIDKLLAVYNLERLYNFDLLCELHHEITATHSDYIYEPLSSNTLSKFRLLPNVFSRSYFLKRCFGMYNIKLSVDFWNKDNPASVPMIDYLAADINNQISSITNHRNWQQRIDKFITYFSYLSFPVFEKTFFILLYDYFKSEGVDSPLHEMETSLLSHFEKHLSFIQYDFTDFLNGEKNPSGSYLEIRKNIEKANFLSKDHRLWKKPLLYSSKEHTPCSISEDTKFCENIIKKFYMKSDLYKDYKRNFNLSYFRQEKFFNSYNKTSSLEESAESNKFLRMQMQEIINMYGER